MSVNALDRSALQRVTKALSAEMAAIGGANTPEMKAAGSVLAKAIRKELATRGSLFQGPHRASKTGKASKLRGLPSAPGEPPHRISGRLYKSIGQEVVGGVRRVGSSWFTSRLLQYGVDADETRKTKAAIAAGKPLTARRLGALRAAETRRRKRAAKRQAHLKIAPRPFMEQALAAALPKMGDDFVATLQHRGGST